MKYILRLSLLAIVFFATIVNGLSQSFEITNITSDPVSCNGGSDGKIQVTISGGTSDYTFYCLKSGTLIAGGITSSTTYEFVNLTSGVYTILVEDSDGNNDINSKAVSQPGILTVNFPSFNACLNASKLIDASVSGGNPPYTYFWEGTAVGNNFLNLDDIEDPTLLANSIGIYDIKLTVIDSKGCTQATPLTSFEVFNNPIVTFDNALDAQCESLTSYTLTGGNPVGGVYSGPGVTSPIFNASLSGGAGTKTLTYTFTDANGCSASDDNIIVVNPVPVVSITSSDDDNLICQGDLVTFTATAGFVNYDFRINGTSAQNGGSNIFSTTGLADNDAVTVVATNNFNCDGTSNSIATDVISAPAVNLTCSDPDAKFCINTSVNFSVESGYANYKFYVNGNLQQDNASNTYTTSTLANNDVISVTVTNAAGCSTTPAGIQVTVYAQPTVSISSDEADNTICVGENVVLTASGASTYLWTPGSLTGAIQTVSPISTTNFIVVGTDGNGCKDTANYNLTVNQLPTVTVSPVSATLCAGESVTLTAGGASTYSWNNGLDAGQVKTVTPVVNTTYTVTGTDANGCQNTASSVITVNPKPTVSITGSDPDFRICNGSSITLTASGADSYAWNTGEIVAAITKSPVSTTTYTVVGTNSYGCIDTLAQEVVVIDKPNIVASANPYTICLGSSSTISATGAGVGGTYTWDNGLPEGSSHVVSPGSTTTYNVTGTTSDGCFNTDTVKVTVNPLPLTTAVVSDPTVCNTSNATITINPSENNINYIVRRSSDNVQVAGPVTGNGGLVSVTIPAASILVVGNNDFTVVATTNLGCSSVLTDRAIVNKRAAVVPTITSAPATCFGENGTIRVTSVSGGTAPYSVSINNGSTFPYAINANIAQPAGTYQLVVRESSAQQCTSTAQEVTITQPDKITFEVDSASATCSSTSDGYIHFINVYGGDDIYQYSIYGDDNDEYVASSQFENLIASSYDLIVKDSKGCKSDLKTITLSNPGQITVGVYVPPLQICYGDSAYIKLLASGGSGSYEFALTKIEVEPLNGWQTVDSFKVKAGETYYGYARDAIKTTCVSSYGEPIKLNSWDKIIYTFEAANTDLSVEPCSYSSNGKLRINNLSGGDPSGSYTFTLTNNTTGKIINNGTNRNFLNLTKGDYVVRVSRNNCFTDSSFTITGPSDIIATVTKTDLTCPGDGNGEIHITSVSGGVGALSYALNAPPFGPETDFISLDGGTYNVLVRDANLCIDTTVVTLFEPLPFSIQTQESIAITCNALNDGRLNVKAAGGVEPYNYTLTPGGTSNSTGDFAGLTDGIYTVELAETNGCGTLTTLPLQITRPDPIMITGVTHTNATCGGVANGSITISATGGTLPRIYTINNGTTTLTNRDGNFTAVPAGTWSIAVTDTNNCPQATWPAVTIDEPTPIIWSNFDIIAPDCFNGTNGSVNATATGGTNTFIYTLNGASVQNNGNYLNLTGGLSYTLVATDTDGCPHDSIFMVSNPAALTVSISPNNTTLCINANQTYSATIENEALPVEYEWTVTGGTFNNKDFEQPIYTAPNLNGSFAVNLDIIDANGCEASASTSLTILAGPSITTHPQNAQACAGQSASFSVAANGSEPITYQWLKNNTPIVPAQTGANFDIASVTAADTGSYSVRVTSCDVTITSNPAKLSLSPAPVINVSPSPIIACEGENVNFVVDASGTDLNYNWFFNTNVPVGTNSNTLTLNNVVAAYNGDYHVVVSGCGSSSTSNPASLTVNNAPRITSQPVLQSVCTGDDVTFNVTAEGSNLTFQWRKDGIDIDGETLPTLTLNNVDATYEANYSVEITGCGGINVISADAELSLNAATVITVQPVGTTLCENEGFNLSVTADGGNLTYEWEKDNILIPGATSPNYSINSANSSHNGSYTVTVNGCNGSETSAPALVTIKTSAITAIDPQSTPVLCKGDNTGSLTINITNGNGDITYTLDGTLSQINNNVFSNLFAKTYTIQVTDASGCPRETNATVGEPASALSISNVETTDETSSVKGTATINLSGLGAGSVQYWYASNPKQEGNVLTGIDAGNYIAYVEDINGCTDSEPFEIIDETNIILNLTSEPTSCFGGSDGKIHINVTQNVGNYTVSIVPPVDTSNAPAGDYTVTVRDDAGNEATKSITVGQPAQLRGIYTITPYYDTPGSGSITVTGAGGTAPYKYAFVDNTYGNLNSWTDLPPASYFVSVKDAKDCPTADTTIEIVDESMLELKSPVAHTPVTCFGTATGTATISILKGMPPYRISLRGPGYNKTIVSSEKENTFTGLAKGAGYQFQVTSIPKRQTVKSASFEIKGDATSMLEITKVVVNPQTTIVPDGSITLTVAGGLTPYTYSKDNGTNYETNFGRFTSLTGDSAYQLAVKDRVGCIVYDTVYVPSQIPLIVEVSKTDESCTGDDGTISVKIISGNKPFKYQLNNGVVAVGDADSTFTGLIAGDYFVTVIDQLDTFVSETIRINESTPIVIDSILTKPSANGSSGELAIYAKGGSGAYNYNYLSKSGLTGSGETNTFTGLPSDTFYISVDDGCFTAYDTAFIAIDTVLLADVTADSVNCIEQFMSANIYVVTKNADPSGPVYYEAVHAVHGTPYYSDLGDGVIYVDDLGTYYIYAEDNEGKKFNDTIEVVAKVTAIANTFDPVKQLCNPGNTTSITAHISGGKAPYIYSWHKGISPIAFDSDSIANNVNEGDYTLHITDTYGCKVQFTKSVFVSGITIQDVEVENSTCNVGIENGSIKITADGDSLHYEWSHNTSLDTSAVSGLASGTYSVRVYNSSCGINSDPIIVASDDSLLVKWLSKSAGCADTSKIGYQVLVGKPDFRFVYADELNTFIVDTSASFYEDTVPAGVYTLQLTDANGCFADTVVAIKSKPDDIVPIEIDSVSTVMASGGPTGSIKVFASGGNGDFYYALYKADTLFRAYQTDSIFTALASGKDYAVRVTDEFECFTTPLYPVEVEQDTILDAYITYKDSTCNGAVVDVVAINPFGDVTYSITTDSFGFKIEAIGNGKFTVSNSGIYHILVSDGEGKKREWDTLINVTQNSLFADIAALTKVPCNEASMGSITAEIHGGVGPFTSAWLVTENLNDTLSKEVTINVGLGNYTFVVKDFAGCEYRLDTSMTKDFQSQVIIDTIIATATNGNDGTLLVQVSGGSEPYNYSYISKSGDTIDNGNSNLFTGLASDTFYVTVTDGCSSDTDTAFVDMNTVLFAKVTYDSVACIQAFLEANIWITPENAAIGAVYYEAVHAVSTDTFKSDLGDGHIVVQDTGTFYLFAKDAMNKVFRDTVIIISKVTKIENVLTVAQICDSASSTSITASVSGGQAPYKYKWFKDLENVVFDNDSVANDVSFGNYTLSITDSFGCESQFTQSVFYDGVRINSVVATPSTCNVGIATGTIKVDATGNNLHYEWTPAQADTAELDSLPSGVYSVKVYNSSCSVTYENILVEANNTLRAEWIISNASCLDTSKIGFNVLEGAKNFTFSYTDTVSGIKEEYATDLFSYVDTVVAGKYWLKLTDAKGCYMDTFVHIKVKPEFPTMIEIDSVVTTLASGGPTGTARVYAHGGDGDLFYGLYQNGVLLVDQKDSLFTSLAAGNYEIRVTDEYFCDTASYVFSIIQDTELKVNIAFRDSSCRGAVVIITPENPVGIVIYTVETDSANFLIEKGSSDSIFFVSHTGNYIIHVEDEEGKIFHDTLLITVKVSKLNAVISNIENPACDGSQLGSIKASVTGGTNPYKAYWFSDAAMNNMLANDFELTGITNGGRYYFKVEDANSCTYLLDTFISEGKLRLISSKIDSSTCEQGFVDGRIKLNITSDANSVLFSWIIPDPDHFTFDKNLQEAYNLAPGTYRLTVSDSKGCELPEQTFEVPFKHTVKLDLVVTQQPLCINTNDAIVTSVVSEGELPYTYEYSNVIKTGFVKDTSVWEDLSAGIFLLNVRDGNLCTAKNSIVINPKNDLNISLYKTDALCTEYGSVFVLPEGGNSPFQYSSNFGDTTIRTYHMPVSNEKLNVGYYWFNVSDNQCSVTSEFEINLKDTLKLDSHTAYNILCDQEGKIEINVLNSILPYNYRWADEKQDSLVDTLGFAKPIIKAGIYKVHIWNDITGCSLYDSLNVILADTMKIIALDSINKNCAALGYAIFNINKSVEPFSYTWQAGDTASSSTLSNIFINDLDSGTYKLQVYNYLGCKAESTFRIGMNNNIGVHTSDVTDKDCINYGSLSFFVSNTSPYQYIWAKEDTSLGSNYAVYKRDNLDSGAYSLKIWNDLGCKIDTAFKIEMVNPLIVSGTSDTTICRGQDFVLNAYAFAGKPVGTFDGVQYEWGPNAKRYLLKEEQKDWQSPILRGNYSGINKRKELTLSLNVIYHQCEVNKEITVSYFPTNGIMLPDTDNVARGDYEVIPSIGGTGVFARYMWTPNLGIQYGTDTSRIMIVNIREPRTYYFTGITYDGCIEQDSVKLVPAALVKPTNVCTPNGDGFNDKWIIEYAEYYPDILIEVFNRWGSKVYSRKGYNKDDAWDGKYKGDDLPIGTYYYIITMKGEKAVTGTITLMR